MITGKLKPATSLRYIILGDNNDNLVWYFGSDGKDHAELEREFQEIFDRYSSAISGGFYTVIRHDKNNKIVNGKIIYTLFLFDVSGSFGLNKEYFKEAIPILKEMMGDSYEITNDYGV